MKKRYIILFTTLIATLVTGISVTVAWYSSGQTMIVDDIELTFRGEKELFISTSDEDGSYKESLTKDDLIKVETFKPITSSQSSLWLESKEPIPKFRDGYPSEDKPIVPQAHDGFYQQELYLYSEDDVIATLDKEAVSFTANETRNRQKAKELRSDYPDLTEEEIFNNLNQISKSMRYSILVPEIENYAYYIIDPTKSEETLFGGRLDSNKSGYFDTYEKDGEILEKVYGEIEDYSKIVYDDVNPNDVLADGPLTCFNANAMKGTKSFNLQKSLDNGLKIAKENSISNDEFETKIQIPLVSQEPTKIVLSIYIEGWDLDNTNLVQHASFLAGLKFKILKENLY